MKISRIMAASAIAACMLTTSVFASGLSAQNSEAKGQRSTMESCANGFGGNKGMQGGMNRGEPAGFGQERKSPLDSLVTAGTITQAQADAIVNAMKPSKNTKRTIEEVLSELVTAGTITQAQSEAVLKVFPSTQGTADSKNSGESSNQRMPGGQNSGEFEGRRGPQSNSIGSLVAAGTITQAQADAIQEAMKTARESNKTMKEVLDTLVTAGNITQAQEDAVLNMAPPAKK